MAERLNVGPLERVLNRAGETAEHFWEKLLSASSILSVEGELKITPEMGGEAEKQSLCKRI